MLCKGEASSQGCFISADTGLREFVLKLLLFHGSCPFASRSMELFFPIRKRRPLSLRHLSNVLYDNKKYRFRGVYYGRIYRSQGGFV